MRILACVIACVNLSVIIPAFANDTAVEKHVEKTQKVNDTIDDFKNAQATKPYFESAYGYAVFPTIGKGAVGVGGAGGKGQVYKRGHYVGDSTMAQLSVGLQLGGQAYSQIIFFENKSAFVNFTHEGFEFNADVSAVAITLGASAEAGTKGVSAGASTTVDSGVAVAKYKKGMAVLTLAKGGLMYEASLAGQKYSFKPAPGRQAKN